MAKIDLGQIVGKSAYDAAVEGGYQGTEEEFNNILANVQDAGSYGLVAKGTVGLSNKTNPIDNFIDGDYTGNNYYIMLSIPATATATDVQNIAAAMPYISAVSLVGSQTRVTISNGSGESAPANVNLDLLVFKGTSFTPSE